MRDVVIFGMGQIAEVVHYYLTIEGKRNVVGFTVDEAFRKADELMGLPVLAFETIEERHPPESCDMFVAVSFRRVNKDREEKVAAAEAKGYTLTSHVSPDATVWRGFVALPNTIIMEHNVIQPFVTIGRNVTVWSGNHIGHHTHIEDNCFIASHAVISGSVTVGEGSFIGVNATIRDNVKIGKRNVLGAGTLILDNTPAGAVFFSEASPMSKVPSHRLRSL
jgi:sugar O-acyltransferase (sialic acid O-acetyltransferase NeuD family)